MEQVNSSSRRIDPVLVNIVVSELVESGKGITGADLYTACGLPWKNPKDISRNLREVVNSLGFSMSRRVRGENGSKEIICRFTRFQSGN